MMNNFEIFNETDEKIDIEEEKKIIEFALKHENLFAFWAFWAFLEFWGFWVF